METCMIVKEKRKKLVLLRYKRGTRPVKMTDLKNKEDEKI